MTTESGARTRWWGRTTRWLRGGRADGGLLLPGRPEGRAVDVRLTPDHLAVEAGDLVARLDWADLLRPSRGTRRPNGWVVGPLQAGRNGRFGVALAVWGRPHDEVATLRGPWRRPPSRFADWWPMMTTSVLVLARPPLIAPRIDLDVEMFAALCAVVADRPAVRGRLADPERVARLAIDLGRKPSGPLAAGIGAGLLPSTTDVLWALHRLGRGHPYSRPLPGDRLPPVDELVDEVVALLATQPGRRSSPVGPARARAVIQRCLTDIEPWPFGALTLD